MPDSVEAARVDADALRGNIQSKYTGVAQNPELGFHFHTGRPLAEMLRYDVADIEALPAHVVESFAGTGNPLALGRLEPGATVLDLGCGSGMDSLLAAGQVGPAGRVVAADMTPAMRAKAHAGARELGLTNLTVCGALAERLPLADGAVDVVISNGVINLVPDKMGVLTEIARVLRPGGRLQIADMVVERPVPQEAKDDIDLWSG